MKDCSITAFIHDNKVCFYSTGDVESMMYLMAEILIGVSNKTGIDASVLASEIEEKLEESKA